MRRTCSNDRSSLALTEGSEADKSLNCSVTKLFSHSFGILRPERSDTNTHVGVARQSQGMLK